jgi:DNA-binding beta-propeller fold protein YncE
VGRLYDAGRVVISGDEIFAAGGKGGSVSVFTLWGDFLRALGAQNSVRMPSFHQCVAIDGDQVFMGHAASGYVHVYGKDGTLHHSLGTHGLAYGAEALYVSNNEVFITEYAQNQIIVLNTNGTFLRAFGSLGSSSGSLHGPCGLCINDTGVFVADCLNNRVCVFHKTGRYLYSFGQYGSGDGDLNMPCDVKIAGDRVFVADYLNHRISVHRLSGKFIQCISTLDSVGQDNILNRPVGIAIANGLLYVTQEHDTRIKVYS